MQFWPFFAQRRTSLYAYKMEIIDRYEVNELLQCAGCVLRGLRLALTHLSPRASRQPRPRVSSCRTLYGERSILSRQLFLVATNLGA
jgi:hypothetical protein